MKYISRGQTSIMRYNQIMVIVLSLILATTFIQSEMLFMLKNSSFNSVIGQINEDLIAPSFSELEWNFPPGVYLGTFEEYLAKHPYTNALFTRPRMSFSPVPFLQGSFSILVSNDIYQSISTKLSEYISDIEESGYSVFLDTVKGGNPVDIKEWVTERYHSGSIGVLFIGDIPAAWAEVSDSQFPCDLFYMDIDGEWLDTNNDGIYDSHSNGRGDMGPELFVGRLYTSTLSWDSQVAMLNDYFDKSHAYRTGSLTVPWRGLEYVDEDWYTMDVFLDNIYFDNTSRYDYGYETSASDYLQKLSESQHFVTVCAHSFPGGHYFSTKPTEAVSYAHIYVFSPSLRDAKLLVGCDDGMKIWLNGDNIFTKDVYSVYRADQYRIDVTLNDGWNSLLCKISQDGGDYQFSARFTDTSFQTFSDLIYQTSNPDISGSNEPEYICSWLINGFHQDIADNFWEYLSKNYLGEPDTTIIPNEGEEMGGSVWKCVDSSSPYIDLDTYGSYDFGVSYAFVNVNVPEDMSCQLRLGYDDGIRAWLNGVQIIDDNRYGGFTYDMTKVNVSLQKGVNTLLMKVSEWMGTHGFSARFCTVSGDNIQGLTYDPAAKPISYISSWLINGVYENPDKTTRLSSDYLQGESTVRPTEGQASIVGNWEKGIGDGCPFDLNYFFDKGDWVYSQTIQDYDPPVLFYNLFSCGPGRFTDEDYLAGSYIFHTSYGLISVASAKSGSMLNFQDFTEPLSQGKTFGIAFMEWFDAQAPYDLWEKEWYYGMVLQGNPMLTINTDSSSLPVVSISSPTDGIYLNGTKIFQFFTPLIIGPTTVHVQVLNPGSGVKDVTFFIDDIPVFTDEEYPFTYVYDAMAFGRKKIDVVLSDITGQKSEDSLIIWKFF
jgi:hypothetical protein